MKRNELAPRTLHGHRDLLHVAIGARKRVRITYDGDERPRELSPYEIRPSRIGYMRSPRTPDLIAWCHEREQYRTFKLDKIDQSCITDRERREA